MRVSSSVFVVCLVCAACPSPSDAPDGGPPVVEVDGGLVFIDAGTDGGGSLPVDAGPLDAGLADAGPGDAGVSEPVAPETRITARPTTVLSPMSSVSFGFECDVGPCTFACSWDREPYAACTSPASRSGFGDGPHQFQVRATRDGLTDLSAATEPFSVDGAPPTVSFVTTPAVGLPNSRASTFTFQCSDAVCQLECSLDGAPFAACPVPASYEGLSTGMHSLSLRGVDEAGNRSMPTSVTWSLSFGWRSFDVTDSTACGVTGARRLACWGLDQSGQLGLGIVALPEGGTAAREQPTYVDSATDWLTVSAGDDHFCATKTSGEVRCWGRNTTQLFGDPAIAASIFNAPTPVATRFARLSVGDQTGCGIDALGGLFCWGEGAEGALGDGNGAPHVVTTPQRVGTSTWSAIAVRNHVCGIQTDGSLWCFGPNDHGEVGGGQATTELTVPTRVGADADWADVSAGESFTCALKQSGAVFCFGENNRGQLGSAVASTEVPTAVSPGTSFRSLRAFGSGACAVSMANQAWCWGENLRGELGSSTLVEFSQAPIRVETNTLLQRVRGTHRLRCALSQADGLECWGDNVATNGGLGRGVRGRETAPVLLDGSYASLATTTGNFVGTSTGGCGIKTTGQLVCWGVGRHLGRAGVSFSSTPVAVTPDLDWTEVKTTLSSAPLGSTATQASGHTCAIRNGLLFCWGLNGSGQLGTGTGANSEVPVAVPPFGAGTTWRTVTTGPLTTCGITSAGRLACWGLNNQGQVGDGTQIIRMSPTGIAGTAATATDWTHVAISFNRVIARRANGTLWLWGAGTLTPTLVDSATDWAEGQVASTVLCGRKTNGTVFCKLNNQPALSQVGTLNDVTALLEFGNSRWCVLRTGGVVTCLTNTGMAVVPRSSNEPGTWRSLASGSDLWCGIGLDDQRRCLGSRYFGNFGDGFDERIPAPVSAP